MRDPIIAEVRRARRKVARLIDENPDQFWADMAALHIRYKDKIVHVNGVRPVKKPAAAKVRRGAS